MPYNSKYTGATAEAVLNSIPGKVGEAPKDSANYARNNGAWVKLNQSLLATVVGPRQMIAQNGSGEQAYTFSFDQPAASITLKSLSISGPGVSLKAGYSKSGFTVVATDIVGDVTAIVTAVFTFGSVDYTISATIIVSYQLASNSNGYEYVDLGLPSGTLWASCNIGATSPEQPGKYFMWGEVEGNTVTGTTPDGGRTYTYTDYVSRVLSKNGGNIFSGDLPLSFDAANYNMGGDWHMPTLSQVQELIEFATYRYDQKVNNVSGCKLVNPSNPEKWIFIPYSGYCSNSTVANTSYAYLWTLSNYTANNSYAYCFRGIMSTGAISTMFDYVMYARPIRAVI